MSSFSNQGEAKATTAEYHRGLGEFYLLSIGMDKWTKDAKDMSDLFKKTLKYTDRNMHLLNENDGPTKDEIVTVFHTELIPKITDKDTLVVYYSGHGTRNSSGDFEFCTKGPYLSNTDFTALVKRVKTERVLLVIDACYAGAFGTLKSKDKPSNSFDAGDLEAFLKSTGKVVMSAASSGLTAPGCSSFQKHLFIASKQKYNQQTVKY